MATTLSQRHRFLPAAASWRRLTTLVTVLLLSWAALLPPGRPTLWWHYLIGVALILAFLGSWHGQHLSTSVRRWVPLATYNRRHRARTAQPRRRNSTEQPAPPPARSTTLEARIVIHLRPQPHGLTTTVDTADQMPWRFVTSWLHRYGVRADEQTITSITRTPPPSGLRTDSASLLTNRTPQHRDTWLTYTLRADQNVGVLTAHQTTMGTAAAADSAAAEQDPDAPQRAALADTTARRLVAELREQGWLATLLGDDEPLPQFVPSAATVRRETWTATEYSDGFRALYAVEPGALGDVLEALPTLGTKALWVSATIRSRGNQPTTIAACVGTLTGTQPGRNPLPGLAGFHGLHREVAPRLTVTGLDHDLPSAQVVVDDLAALHWPTSAPGVPIGYNRSRQPVYLGLASPEPVRITVTGTREFHVGIMARLALSGLPIALYTADVRSWGALANHGAPQQFSVAPTPPPPGAIAVTDGTLEEVPASPITVTLRRPQSSKAPTTTIVITQDGRHANLFRITTPHDDDAHTTGRSTGEQSGKRGPGQMLSTRLAEATARR